MSELSPGQETRLERWSRHPLGVVVRIAAAATAVFFGGVTLVLAALNYSFKRPASAPWTERAFESAAIAVVGVVTAIVVLMAAWRPTVRRLAAVAVVLVAAPLLTRLL